LGNARKTLELQCYLPRIIEKAAPKGKEGPGYSPHGLTAVRAESKGRFYGFSTIRAVGGPQGFFWRGWPCGFRGDHTAPVTLKKWDPLLNLQERYKEEGNIVIHPLETRLIKAAGWTHPWLFVDPAGLWLNAADEEEHLPTSR
jgi:hypothetical protein